MRIAPRLQQAAAGFDFSARSLPSHPVLTGPHVQVSGAQAQARVLVAALREKILRLEEGANRFEAKGSAPRLRHESTPWILGVPEVDAHLPERGLARHGLHDVAPMAYGDTPGAMGFALALALRRLSDGFERRPVLWCRLDYQVREHGALYGHGLESLGLSRQRLLTVTLKTPISLLWTMEEALKSSALAVVLGDCALQHSDLTVTRRLSLAAAEGKSAGILVFSRNNINATASMSRWQVATAASQAQVFDARAVGAPAWGVSLSRIRSGRPGQWTLNWNRQDHAPHHFTLVSGLRGGAFHPRETEDQSPRATQGPALRAG